MELSIYALAHEIKNPLAITKGYLEMLNEKNISKYKELIENSLDEALGVLDEYMLYNKLSVKFEIVDIILLLEEVIKDFDNLYTTNFKIITIYEDLFINADYDRLLQVFKNIFKNSIEANADNINVYLKVINNSVVINISDDGGGISDLLLLNGEISTKSNGHGIGHMIAKRIIEYHNGSIEYKNIENGCDVCIKLPFNI